MQRLRGGGQSPIFPVVSALVYTFHSYFTVRLFTIGIYLDVQECAICNVQKQKISTGHGLVLLSLHHPPWSDFVFGHINNLRPFTQNLHRAKFPRPPSTFSSLSTHRIRQKKHLPISFLLDSLMFGVCVYPSPSITPIFLFRYSRITLLLSRLLHSSFFTSYYSDLF